MVLVSHTVALNDIRRDEKLRDFFRVKKNGYFLNFFLKMTTLIVFELFPFEIVKVLNKGSHGIKNGQFGNFNYCQSSMNPP